MYGNCIGESSCLVVGIKRQGDGLKVRPWRIGKELAVDCSVSESMRVGVRHTMLDIHVSVTGLKINVTCRMICTIDNYPYIRAAPKMLWLTSDMLSQANIEIKSNTNWKIE